METEEPAITTTTADLDAERRQLSACWWGFLLLGSGLLLQVMNLSLSRPADADPKIVYSPTFLYYAVAAGTTLLTFVPASVLFSVFPRSWRWRQSCWWLLGAFVLDAVTLLVAAVIRPPGIDLTYVVEPWPIRLTSQLGTFLGWMELWWMLVLIGQFGLASGSRSLVERTEHLGYMVLAGLAVNLALGGWLLPSEVPISGMDEWVQSTIAIHDLLMILTVVWLLILLAAAGSVARLMSRRCAEMRAKLDSTSPA